MAVAIWCVARKAELITEGLDPSDSKKEVRLLFIGLSVCNLGLTFWKLWTSGPYLVMWKTVLPLTLELIVPLSILIVLESACRKLFKMARVLIGRIRLIQLVACQLPTIFFLLNNAIWWFEYAGYSFRNQHLQCVLDIVAFSSIVVATLVYYAQLIFLQHEKANLPDTGRAMSLTGQVLENRGL
jgi:hypothetical protein